MNRPFGRMSTERNHSGHDAWRAVVRRWSIASHGSPWWRVDRPPAVTVRPSNFISGRYHGWITDGVLFEC